jgi:hypothetical protein
MKHNEPAGHAEMLQGAAEQVSERLCAVLAERGLF